MPHYSMLQRAPQHAADMLFTVTRHHTRERRERVTMRHYYTGLRGLRASAALFALCARAAR